MGHLAVVVAIVLGACGRIGFDEGLTPDVGERARASFSVGEYFACAVRAGVVYCWGERETGQGGDGGDEIPGVTPRAVVGLPPATQVAAGRYHACSLSVDGTVWCWGGDEYGRLGNVPGGVPTVPGRVPLPEGAIEIGVAYDHSCAVLASGPVWCWGLDHHGQLGRGTIGGADEARGPGAVVGLADAIHVSVDDDTSCALRRDGTVVCWGENGAQTIDTTGTDVPTPRPVAGLDGATALSLGGDHVCAVIGGRVGCRGRGNDGELGGGDTTPSSATVVFSQGDDYVTLESAYSHTCAVRATGDVACWGDNRRGVLGDGTNLGRASATSVLGLSDALAVSTGTNATCALRADDSIACWGWGARGLLGDGRSAVLGAARVAAAAGATSIAVGDGHTCASDGATVACWGRNDVGQLGSGSVGGVVTSPQVISFAWPSSVVQLVAGALHTCARLDDGSVYCWGDNDVGQLGDGTEDRRSTPTLVSMPPSSQLAAGHAHTCAISSGTLRCWGYNFYGQLGDGTTVQRELPTQIMGGIDEVVTGSQHTCARSVDQVTCWGANDSGQLGDGTITARTTPTFVSGVSASGLAAGGYSTCARIAGAANVWCWGLAESNVLDVPGAPYAQTTPAVSRQTELFAIGGSTACLRQRCWGQNGVGQVGAGAFGYFYDPNVVANLPSAAQAGGVFAIGWTHACAIVPDPALSVWCWGENSAGEIGNGEVSEPHAPTSTVAFP